MQIYPGGAAVGSAQAAGDRGSGFHTTLPYAVAAAQGGEKGVGREAMRQRL